jgi:hypothetical protein
MDQEQLLKDINQAYDEQALQALCFRLGIDYELLEGDDLPGKAHGLLRIMRQRGRLADLVRLVVQDNPPLSEQYEDYLNREMDEAGLVWLDELGGTQDASNDTGLTMRWPADTGQSREAVKDVDNPYSPGAPLTDPLMFFGRQAELGFLRQTLLRGGHIAIVGPPHIGKTSLQLALVRQRFPEKNRLLFSWPDLGDSRTHTLPGLLNTIWQQWWRQIRSDISPALTELERFVTAVGKLCAAGYQPVICLDGFEQLAQRPEAFDNSFFETWRLLAEERQVLLITTSQRPLADLFRQADRTTKFYTSFKQLDLGLLDEQAAHELLTVPAQRRGLVIPAGATSHLLQLCGPHPLYLQIAAKYLFDGLAVHSYSWADLKEHFTGTAEPYWRALWQGLSPLAREYFPLKPIVPASAVAARQYRLLAVKGLVIQEGERYRPFSDGFANWVRANRL